MRFFDYISDVLHERITASPNRYFSESDIHSEVYSLLLNRCEEEGYTDLRSSDGYIVNLVHHEYPTPFRCYMKDGDFRVVTQNEFSEARRKKQFYNYRRGYLDIVVFNPDFVKSNDMNIISGKSYAPFRKSYDAQKVPVLKTAIEVMYFPMYPVTSYKTFTSKKVNPIRQDYKKLGAIMDFKFQDNVPFSEEVGMIVVSNALKDSEIKTHLTSFPFRSDVQMKIITSPKIRMRRNSSIKY